MNREAIYGALFDRLAALEGFQTISRRLKHWADVPKDAQPALYMAQTGEQPSTTTGQPTKWRLQLDIYLYVQVEPDQAPAPQLNPLLDAVCNLLNTPHPITGRYGLGIDGVEWARVDGPIETDEGTLGSQAVAIVPVTIFAT